MAEDVRSRMMGFQVNSPESNEFACGAGPGYDTVMTFRDLDGPRVQVHLSPRALDELHSEVTGF